MSATPLLSVLLTTHSKPAHLEQLLEKLLNFKAEYFEIILVNDAASLAQSQSIENIFDKYPHYRSFLFEHKSVFGRGSCLNEALLHSQGKLIWAPLRADRLNEALLTDTVQKFSNDPAAFWMLDSSLPDSSEACIQAARSGMLPDDSRFVWNRSIIPSDQLYFQPSMTNYHGCELALRLDGQRPWKSTDAFFVAPREPEPPAENNDIQELLFTYLRIQSNDKERQAVLQQIESLNIKQKAETEPEDGLEKAWLLKDRDPRNALSYLNEFLKKHPENEEACKLKISLLERLRRHVEASELKHKLQKQKRNKQQESEKEKLSQVNLFSAPTSESPQSGDSPAKTELEERDIELSIVVPTTGDGKPILEELIVRLEEECDARNTELIVIDNASIDDTFDYLEQLKDNRVLNIRVITNEKNLGFAKSVNQGIGKAKGDFLLVIHNDIQPEPGSIDELVRVMKHNSYIGVIGPVLDQSDLAEQTRSKIESSDKDYIKMESVDSSCMLIRKSTGVTFDESFGAAFFEDADLCNQIAKLGFHAAVATKAFARHHHRLTTNAMGLNLEPELHWKNAEYYRSKWNGQKVTDQSENGDPIETLRNLNVPVNPLNPPSEWIKKVNRLLTDVVRTQILKNEWDEDFLFKLTSILLIADEREFLRTIENRLDDLDLPDSLIKSLIRYYFKRNIFSRCRHYLEKAATGDPFYDLYRLRMAVADKEVEEAVDLLNKLMKEFPCHPELYKLTGDVHRMNGNEGEAKSFYALANQLNPGHFLLDENEFEIKF